MLSPRSSDNLVSSIYTSFERDQGQKPVMMICILGGLTYLEIAAFRYEIVLATTGILSGSQYIQSLSYELS
jgi:hypothetical protein